MNGRPRRRPSDEAPYLEVLVRDLQRQNREAAGVVGSLPWRLAFADDRLRAVEAPKADTSEIAPGCDSVRSHAETTQTPATPRNGRPWWRQW